MRFPIREGTTRVAITIIWALSNQGERSINFNFIMVPLRKKY